MLPPSITTAAEHEPGIEACSVMSRPRYSNWPDRCEPCGNSLLLSAVWPLPLASPPAKLKRQSTPRQSRSCLRHFATRAAPRRPAPTTRAVSSVLLSPAVGLLSDRYVVAVRSPAAEQTKLFPMPDGRCTMPGPHTPHPIPHPLCPTPPCCSCKLLQGSVLLPWPSLSCASCVSCGYPCCCRCRGCCWQPATGHWPLETAVSPPQLWSPRACYWVEE